MTAVWWHACCGASGSDSDRAAWSAGRPSIRPSEPQQLRPTRQPPRWRVQHTAPRMKQSLPPACPHAPRRGWQMPADRPISLPREESDAGTPPDDAKRPARLRARASLLNQENGQGRLDGERRARGSESAWRGGARCHFFSRFAPPLWRGACSGAPVKWRPDKRATAGCILPACAGCLCFERSLFTNGAPHLCTVFPFNNHRLTI